MMEVQRDKLFLPPLHFPKYLYCISGNYPYDQMRYNHILGNAYFNTFAGLNDQLSLRRENKARHYALLHTFRQRIKNISLYEDVADFKHTI
jgi:hypothetical protein